MPSTRSSVSTSESVATRVLRYPRAAAVDARQRLSAMAEEAFEQTPEFVRPAAQPKPATVNHRYMLRSMRRQEQ